MLLLILRSNCTLEILKIASKLKKVVIGTTGFSRNQENQIKKYYKKIPILKAGNMSLGVNLLMYLTEIASKSLDDKYLSKIFEIHHKYKRLSIWYSINARKGDCGWKK